MYLSGDFLKDPALLIMFFYHVAYWLNINLLQDIYMQDTFIYNHFNHLFLNIVMGIFKTENDNYECEFCIDIVSFIVILAVCLVYCLCIGY